MSFVVDIRVDPGSAKQVIAGVGAELDKVDRAAGRARDSMGRFVGGAATGAERAKQATHGFAGQLSALSRAWDGVVGAMRREADMLERIRGPARQHAQDMQTLTSMYRRGAITAREFTAEVQRMNRAMGMTPRPSFRQQLREGAMQGAGFGFVAGGAAGVAAAGVQAGIGAIRGIADLSDQYTNLGNRLRQITSSTSEHNRLMDATRAIANRTRMEWAATGETFVRLTNATKEMGLSQRRVLRLTETINKAFSMSGASSTEAAAGMLQLSQAFASGRLQGDEFRTLAEAVPSILDMISKEMGVSRGALKQLGSEGKITADVLVKAFENAQSSIDAGFAKTAPTLSQQWSVFKNEMSSVFGRLLSESGILPSLVEALTTIVTALGEAVDALKDAGGGLGDLLPDKVKVSRGTLGNLSLLKSETGINVPSGTIANARRLFGSEGDQQIGRFIEFHIDQLGQLSHAFKQANAEVDAFKGVFTSWGAATNQSGGEIAQTFKAIGTQLRDLVSGPGETLGLFFNRTSVGAGAVGSALQTLGFNFASLGKSIDSAVPKSGVLADFMRRAMGGGDPWGPSDEELRKRVNAPRGRGRAPRAAEPTNIWRSESPISDALFGPDFASDMRAAIDEFKLQMTALQSWEATAASEDNWLVRAMNAGRDALRKASEEEKKLHAQLTTSWQARIKELESDPFRQAMNALESQATDVAGAMESAFTNAYAGIESALVQLVTTGKVQWRSLIDSMLADLTRLIVRELIALAIKSALTGASGGGAAAASVLASGGSPSQVAGAGAMRSAPGVPYMGGGVPFRAPTIAPGGPQAGNISRDAGPRNVTLHLDDTQNEARFEDMTLKVIRRNAPAIAGLITGK